MEDGFSLTIGASALSAIAGALVAYWKAKRSQPRKIENDPLNVSAEKKPVFVTIGECNRRMCELEQRTTSSLHDIAKSQNDFINKIEELDQTDERRICSLNQRVDSLVEKTSEVAGKMEVILSGARKKIG